MFTIIIHDFFYCKQSYRTHYLFQLKKNYTFKIVLNIAQGKEEPWNLTLSILGSIMKWDFLIETKYNKRLSRRYHYDLYLYFI